MRSILTFGKPVVGPLGGARPGSIGGHMIDPVTIQGHDGPSRILIGERLNRLGEYLPPGSPVVCISDQTVYDLYGDGFPSADVILIGQGEGSKTLDTVTDIYRQLMDLGADRGTVVAGIGGGVVCDVAGFAASTFMRGLRFGFVATTLLAQVDASVGGKNGVNLDGFKNMVGVFRQPEFVICDTALLRTLPDVEIRSGFGEIIKHAAIASKEKFDFLVAHRKQALARDIDVINTLVGESVRIKAGVVNRDETERGERRKLNFGHTIGHAVERATGLAHGEAVSVGMRAAADLSVSRGLLDPAAARRLEELLADMGLPTRVDLDPDVVIDGILRDKKREQDDIQFVLLDGIGSAVVHPLPVETVTAFIKADACRG